MRMLPCSLRFLSALLVGIFFTGWLACEEKSRPTALAAPAASALLPPPPTKKNLPRSVHWKRVETLIGEQKFEEARALCQDIRTAAQKSGNTEEWTEALVKETQLRIGLFGHETAVRFLRTEAWPKDLLSQVALELYYARSLVQYLVAYSWEIHQRERVVTSGEIDLKTWSRDQIYGEVLAAYARLWEHRAELSLAHLDLLSTMLGPGNYPAQVRGSLRDELSYFIVDALTNTMFWRPEDASALSQLDFRALLEGNDDKPAVVKIDDAKVHPLLRAMAVLDDLETFYREQKGTAGDAHKEAALEARLTRQRRLFQTFSDAASRSAIMADLERRLPEYRAQAWWAMGMATLADFLRTSDDLGRAYAVAKQGTEAYPNSVGGQSCLYFQKSLEAADFRLTAMASDGPNKRSLLVSHKNLPRLYFRAYAQDLISQIETSQDYNLLLNPKQIGDLIAHGRKAAEWSVELPPTPDYREHSTYVTPPLSQNGLYVIVASLHSDFRQKDNRVLAVNLILSDLMLLTRQQDTQLEVSVVSASSGQPISGANVFLYLQNYSRHHQRIASQRTDGQGIVRLGQKDGQSCYVVAQNGRDATVDRNTFYLYRGSEPPAVHAALVYSDRSIYRPQQKIHYKVVAYRGKLEEGQLQPAAHARLLAVLLDANGQEVAQQVLSSNDFGTAFGEFLIPSGRLLGQWRIEMRGGTTGFAYIQVEEYKRPTFEVSFKDPATPLRLDQPATLIGEARYFFGQPVTSGQIKWQISREPVYPWWWSIWGVLGSGERSRTIAQGRTVIGEGGTFNVAFTPAADVASGEADKDISYHYLVKAEMTDEGGETRSAERRFRLGRVAIEASIEAAQGFAKADGGGILTVRRASLDGQPRAGEGQYRIFAVAAPAQALLPADVPIFDPPGGAPYRTPGDKLRPRWQSGYSAEAMLSRFPDGAEKGSGKLVHDAKGLATLRLPALPPGPYRLRYETKDEFGQKAQNWHDFWVSSDADKNPLPLGLPLLLRAEQSSVAVGQKARVLLATGLLDQTIVVEQFRAGKLLRRSLQKGSSLLEIPIGEEDRGGLGILAWTVRDHQYLTQSLSINVPWDNKELRLEFASFRDKLRPGSHETFRVIARSTTGKALGRGMVELLAYMYDRSLDLFAPHTPPSLLSLFPFRGAIPQARSSSGTAPVHWIVNQLAAPTAPAALHGATLIFYENYAIGGMGMRGLGMERSVPMRMMARSAAPAGLPPPPPPPPPGQPPAAQATTTPLADSADLVENKRARSDVQTAGTGGAASENAAFLRSNFAETAFFLPTLLTDGDGTAIIEFQVPSSVTSWNVWVLALTKDLRSGSLQKETHSIKELMVRPYLPRFFREADSAELRVMINNASNAPKSGTLHLRITDADTQQDMLKLFQIEKAEQTFIVLPHKSATLSFALSAPPRVGTYAFSLMVEAGSDSDGELHPVSVLPSRMHLSESRFAALHGKEQRTLRFADLAKNDDPTRRNEQLVVTLDAQLFYTVLKALPSLINSPYESVEQTLNRFLATGIVSSIYGQYPAVAKMAKEFAARPTPLENFTVENANRAIQMEESPWLAEAQGNRRPSLSLVNVLDPRLARTERDSALSTLQKAQTAIGGFPWFSGGPPSPYMTLYLMYGFAKASEFHVEIPKALVQRGWQYLGRHFRDAYTSCLAKDVCDGEFLTLLNYVATAYPDASYVGDALSAAERQALLTYSFRHWKQHSPYLKALLALTLKRMGRPQDARLVWDSVMDAAKSAPDQGVFWAPEERAWLWYNDTIESHAFALRTLLELAPQSAKKDGLVLWLLLNKKLNQWKSTRATAEVLYSLVSYLKHQGELAQREEATVTIGPAGQLGRESFVFDPGLYSGKTQIVLPAARLTEGVANAAQITVEKSTKGFLFASATWHYSTDKLPSQGHGDFLNVERSYFKRELDGANGAWVLRPLAAGEILHPGDQVEVHLALRSKHAAEYVHLRDPRPAGMEPDNNLSRWQWDLGLAYYQEVRDSGMNFFFEALPPGEYTFKYRLRCNLRGVFRVGPATLQPLYAPEFSAYSAGHLLKIGDSGATALDASARPRPKPPQAAP